MSGDSFVDLAVDSWPLAISADRSIVTGAGTSGVASKLSGSFAIDDVRTDILDSDGWSMAIAADARAASAMATASAAASISKSNRDDG